MNGLPGRVFLDTNVYITGGDDPASPEARLLRWLDAGLVEIVISNDLIDQIVRVGRRVHGKDWASALVQRLWKLNVQHVLLDADELVALETSGQIPREDAAMYLTARAGRVQCFISANRELVRALVEKTKDFECLTPADFAQKYLRP